MNHYEYIELKEGETYDPNVLVQGVPFTQQDFYGTWQREIGRTVRRFTVRKGTSIVAYFQLIVYPLMKGKTYIYIPYGPVTTDTSAEFYTELTVKLREIAREHSATFVRLDFTPAVSDEKISSHFKKAPQCTYHSAYFQPRTEWFLGLAPSEDELLKMMHEKTRYSIRLADRKEIVTEIVTTGFDQYFDDFYTLMQETATRNGFKLHEASYFRSVFKSLPLIAGSYLSVARYNGVILAIDVVLVSGGIAMYVFGASSTEERNRMPAYSAQWKAIVHAKSLGCTDYNFGAISTEGDSYTGWDSLTPFKKKFGGYVVQHSPFVDIVILPFWYYAYTFRKYLKTFGI